METIQNLESQVRELSKKCDLESVLCEELNLEIQSLQKSLSKAAWSTHSLLATSISASTETTAQVVQDTLTQVDEPKAELTSSVASTQVGPSTDSSISTTSEAATLPSMSGASRDTATSTNSSIDMTVVTPIGTSATYQQNCTMKYLAERPLASTSSAVASVETPTSSMSQTRPSEATTNEIRRILARIEQDNRLLAELEKSRAAAAAADSPLSTDNVERLKATIEEKKVREANQPSSMKPSITIQELEKLMAKLEQDNRVLAELDKKRSILDSQGLYSANPSSLDTFQLVQAPTPSPSLISLRDQSAHSMVPASGSIPSVLHHYSANADEMLDSIDFIELPGRGRCNIYCARYTYDPIKQSPNENPEAELCLSAGDYVIIYGEMDEDGFFNGELLDGRKGLVPSNFVEKLSGEELFDFHATVLYGNRDSDDSSVSFSYAQDMETAASEDFLLPEDFHRMNDYVDLDDIEDLDEDKHSDSGLGNEEFTRGVPPPQRLILERQLNKSILIGWVPPDVQPGMIEAYHVYVDGVPRVTVKSTERTRALIEGVDSSRPHRISVRSVSSTGYHSKDAACTIVVGKDFPLAPTCVKASHITATAALISWLPSNSNFQHVVAVNSVEVKVVQPGYFRHTVTGLSPNNVYRVSIRVRPGKLLYNDEKNPKRLEMLVSNVEFRTLPKGLPDPPVNVQVEQGPQDGTLLVTWLPVPSQPASPLVSPVTGYAVFAAGKRVAEVDSPSGDHALIDGCQLLMTNKKCITVRSKSIDGLSTDSITCVVPNEILRSVQKTLILNARMHDERTPRERRSSSSDSESDTELTELLNHVNRRARAFDPMDSPFAASKMKTRSHANKAENTIGNQDYKQDQEYDNQPRSMGKASGHRPPAQPLAPSPAPSQRRQDWKEQSYSSRSREGPAQKYQHGEQHRNSPKQMVIEPEEDLSDKEIYPSSRMSIPSIEITKESVISDDCNDVDGYSEEDYNPGSRSNPMNSPEEYSSSPPHPRSQQRHRSDPAIRHSRPSQHNEAASPNPQRRSSQFQNPDPQRTAQQRKSPHHRGSLPTALNRGQPPVSAQNKGPQSHPASHSPRHRPPHCPPDQSQPRPYNRSGPRMPPPGPHRGGHDAPMHNSNPSHFERRRSSGSTTHPPPRQRGMDYHHDPVSKYDDPLACDSFSDKIGDGGDNRVRYFVALFDYDPQTMSPNPDAADEELPFQEGQLIKIYGDKDPDGFYRGESNGQIGLVPGNMVSEVQVEEDSIPRETMNDNVSGRPRTLRTVPVGERETDSNWSPKNVRKMVAIYDYDPQEVSPGVDSEMELAFSVGDVIYVIGDVDEDGFYVGELNGIKGLVPSNFLREVPLDEEEKRQLQGTPKGQGRSHFGLGDCRWNWEERTTTSTQGIRLALEDIAESLDVLQRNNAILGTATTRNNLRGTPHPLQVGTRMEIEDLHQGDHRYRQEPYDTNCHSQDLCHLISTTGRRPTYLELKNRMAPRMQVAPDPNLGFENIQECPLPKQNNRKGIFSSFKGIFKPTRKV